MEGGAGIVSLPCLTQVMDNWLSISTSCSFCSCNGGGRQRNESSFIGSIKTSASQTSLASQLPSIKVFWSAKRAPWGQIISNLRAPKKGWLILIIIFKMGLSPFYSFVLLFTIFQSSSFTCLSVKWGIISHITPPCCTFIITGAGGENHKGLGFSLTSPRVHPKAGGKAANERKKRSEKCDKERVCEGEREQQESFQSGSKLMKRLVRWPQGLLIPSMTPEMEM